MTPSDRSPDGPSRVVVIPYHPYLEDVEYVSPWLEPTFLPGPSDPGSFLMGADPGWSREREVDRSIGETCPRCGSTPESRAAANADIEPGDNKVCGSCQAWGKDDALADSLRYEFARRGSIDPVLRTDDPKPAPTPEGFGPATRTRTFTFD